MLGEFLVIVIGVMVALAADSWIESKRDGERARAAISLLIEDLAADSARMDELAPLPPRHDSIRSVLWSTPSDAGLPEDSVLTLFGRLLYMPDWGASRSTYESLVATDGIRYLGDDVLGAALLDYYEEHQANVGHWHGWYIQAWVTMSDMMRKYQTPAPLSFEEGLGHWEEMPLRLTTSWRAIREDDLLMSQLYNVAIYEQSLAEVLQEAREANVRLLTRARALANIDD